MSGWNGYVLSLIHIWIEEEKAISHLSDILTAYGIDVSAEEIRSTKAVSYTHLDVYKRQVWNYLALEYMLCDFVYIAWKYVGRYRMFIWNCHWSYIKSGQFIFRESGIVFFQLL